MVELTRRICFQPGTPVSLDPNEQLPIQVNTPRPNYDLTVNDYANPKPEVESNLNLNRIKDETVNEKINALSSKVRTELRKLLVEHINQECGVSTFENVLDAIEDQVDIFLHPGQGECFTDRGGCQ